MTQPQGERISPEVATPQNGKGGPVEKPETRYCAICGERVTTHGQAVERFGEAFCCEGHAEEFVRVVREARIQAAAALAAQTPEPQVQRLEASPDAPKQRDWKRYLKMAVCCGASLLALVFLVGGGGAVLGAAGASLPFLAALACPLGMYFMMRAMMKTEHKDTPKDEGEEVKRSGGGNR